MDLVRQVYKICFILFLCSCTTTTQNDVLYTAKILKLNKLTPDILKKSISTKTNIKPISKLEIISNGSISKMQLLDSDLWIGKLGGELIRYNLYTKEVTKFLSNSYSIKDFSIKQIIKNNNSVYILQSDRVTEIRLSDYKTKIFVFPTDISRSTDMIAYRDNLIISTLGYGIIEFNTETKDFSTFSTKIDYISSVYLLNNILYIGSMNQGLYILNLSTKNYNSRLNLPLALFYKNIVAIEYINNTFWFGTNKNGLIKWNTITNEIDRSNRDKSVSSIYINNGVSCVSYLGYGVEIERNNNIIFESIDTILQTNSITSVKFFNNNLILGNIKKGVIIQEFNL